MEYFGILLLVIVVGLGVNFICEVISPTPYDPNTDINAEWRPNPGIEKHPDSRPVSKYGYSLLKSDQKCPRCKSTNVSCDSNMEHHAITSSKRIERFNCFYCNYRWSKNISLGTSHNYVGWH